MISNIIILLNFRYSNFSDNLIVYFKKKSLILFCFEKIQANPFQIYRVERIQIYSAQPFSSFLNRNQNNKKKRERKEKLNSENV